LSLIAHVVLGVAVAFIAALAIFDAYFLDDTPERVDTVLWMSFLTWCLTPFLVVWIWATGRQAPWLPSVGWAGCAILAIVIAVEPISYPYPPPDSYYPAWSPDSGQLVFDSNRTGVRQVYRMGADGGAETQLTGSERRGASEVDNGYLPRFSPDGGRILFMTNTDPHDRRGNRGIAVMNDDGSGQRRLTPRRSIDYDPAWSPDGSSIAFVSERDGTPRIYVMDADGTNQRRLTSEEAAERAPEWSPDGTRIALERKGAGNRGRWGTYIVAVDGRSPRRLLHGRFEGIGAAWSPTGSDLALAVFTGEGWDLDVVRVDGSGRRRLISGAQSRASWSPDGQRIALCREDAIWVIDAQGSRRRRLTEPRSCSVNHQSPAWSPDGKQIAYARGRFEYAEPFDVYVTDAERGGERRLTR
jgi:TolB protein